MGTGFRIRSCAKRKVDRAAPPFHGRGREGKTILNKAVTPNAVVAVGAVRFGNALPLALIAGPCALESRAHALEMAAALKEIAAKVGVGLVYKTSFDKANRTSAKSARGLGLDAALPIFAEIKSQARRAGAHRRARGGAMRARRAKRRRVADPGVPVAADRSAGRGGADRQGGQRQEGPVPGAVGHEERRRQRSPAPAMPTCW